MYDVITVGGATVDLFLETNVHEHFVNNERELCYPLGMKIKVNKVETFTGGGGSNTAVAFSRLGLKTGYAGKIGDDVYGGIIYKEFAKERVKFLGKISKYDKTDFSIVLDSHRHDDRTILNYKDASSKLSYTDVNKARTKWYYFSSLTGEGFETLKKIAKHAKGNANIGFNVSSYLAEKGSKYLHNVLDACSVFVLNKEEAEMIIGKSTIEKMLVKIAGEGPEIVCITDGEKGSYTYDGEHFYYQKAKKIKVVEKTGAGDAYAATFIAGLIKGRNIEHSLSMAAANAESVIRHKGAKNVLLHWNKIMNARSIIRKKRA